jgi:hypothetical protein
MIIEGWIVVNADCVTPPLIDEVLPEGVNVPVDVTMPLLKLPGVPDGTAPPAPPRPSNI